MLKKLSVKEINIASKNREIWCWGCGYKLSRMLAMYADEPFTKRINGLIDGNVKIWGEIRKIGDREIQISDAADLGRSDHKKIVLLITSDAYKEIYKIAVERLADFDVIYSRYPSAYDGLSNKLMKLFCKMPLKRQLLFYVGSNGSQPRDNSDEVVRYMKEGYTGKKFKIVYLTEYPCEIPDGVAQISTDDIAQRSGLVKMIRYCYLYARSSYLFYESEPIEKVRSQQKTIYLNHGTIPLKYVKDALKQPESLDYAICPGKGCTFFYKDQYGIDENKLLYIMQPRAKQLFCSKTEKIDEMFHSKGKQFILWLPTFRKLAREDGSERRDSEVKSPLHQLFHSDRISKIDELLERNGQRLILKHHPREGNVFLYSQKNIRHIFIISDEEIEKQNINVHHLLNRADALISDYSGITYEYMLLDRPLGYYIPDIAVYTRGFSVADPLEYMPGFKMYDAEGFMKFLSDLSDGKDEFALQRRNLTRRLFDGVNPKTGAEDLIAFIDNDRGGYEKYSIQKI